MMELRFLTAAYVAWLLRERPALSQNARIGANYLLPTSFPSQCMRLPPLGHVGCMACLTVAATTIQFALASGASGLNKTSDSLGHYAASLPISSFKQDSSVFFITFHIDFRP